MESEDGTEEPDISAAVTADTSDTLPPGGERQMGEGAGCGEGRGGGCVNGLWSVNNVNCLPSNRNRKWQMAELAASSSLSKVEYWISGAESFLLKKANGTQDEEILCWKTVPTWVYEASTASKIGAEGTGWSNLGTWSRADLVAEKDCSIAESQEKFFRDPFRAESGESRKVKTGFCLLSFTGLQLIQYKLHVH